MPTNQNIGTDLAELNADTERLIACAERVLQRHKSATTVETFIRKLGDAHRSLTFADPAIDASQVDLLSFGEVLRERRDNAKMSQKEIAALAGVSTSMIRAIEHGERRPGLRVLMRLLSIPTLELDLEDLAGSTPGGMQPAIWLAPEYDPRELLRELCAKLGGSGCSLEQSFAYLDTQSATDYLALANQPAYQVPAFDKTQPLDQLARQIAAECRASQIDIVAMGCGDAKKETQLAESLVRYSSGRFKVRLLLLDISHALLTEGYKHARATLQRSVTIIALQGNFHDIAQYPIFHAGGDNRRCRVLTMLGNTLANLDNELRFFRDNLAGASLGDYFLLDYTSAFADPGKPSDIRRLDPALERVRDTHRTWLTGIFRRYCAGLKNVDIEIELNLDTNVRGSYELAYVANVQLGDARPARRFVVLRIRRYEGDLLDESLGRCGWSAVARLPYGAKGSNRLQLMLLQRSDGVAKRSDREPIFPSRGSSVTQPLQPQP